MLNFRDANLLGNQSPFDVKKDGERSKMCSPQLSKKSENNLLTKNDDTPKMCSSKLSEKSETQELKKTSEHNISPLNWGGPAGQIFRIFGMWCVDAIIQDKFHVDCNEGHGAGFPKSGVSHSLSSYLQSVIFVSYKLWLSALRLCLKTMISFRFEIGSLYNFG